MTDPRPLTPEGEAMADLFMDLRLDGRRVEGWTYQQTARHYARIIVARLAAERAAPAGDLRDIADAPIPALARIVHFACVEVDGNAALRHNPEDHERALIVAWEHASPADRAAISAERAPREGEHLCSCGHTDGQHYEGCLECDRYVREHGMDDRD